MAENNNNSFSGYLLALTAIFFWSVNIIIASDFGADSLERPEKQSGTVVEKLAAGFDPGFDRHCF